MLRYKKLYDNNMQHALIFHKFRLGHNEVTFILHISNNLSIFKGNGFRAIASKFGTIFDSK